ncbi:TPA: hypothetical protein QEL15_003065 [Stenotrophomonas maltophilia]|nr:hypothetical protein [Stenotrophomonas maltophilia]
MRLSPLILLGILPLAACSHAGSSTAAASTPPPAAAEAAHECRPDTLEAFTGKPADEATVKQLVAASGARNARVVKPGMAVTMDFRQDRVTVQVDAQNRIERASCG